MIRILFFASLRERLGTAEEQIDLPGNVQTVADLLGHLQARGGQWRALLGVEETVLVAVNRQMAQPDTTIREGDEVGFFPPVTGG